jgi:NAD-dependent dihydropyrimidine dehydrogenase PreA subunit
VLLNNTAKKRRRRGEVDDDKNDRVCQNDCDTIVTCPIYTTEPGSFLSLVRKTFPCRFYRQTFKGKKFGLQCTVIEGRMVVARNDTCSSKPAIGDILLRLKDYTLPSDPSECVLDEVCENMRRLLSSTAGAVELTFAESPMFWSVVEPILKKKQMEEEAKEYDERN